MPKAGWILASAGGPVPSWFEKGGSVVGTMMGSWVLKGCGGVVGVLVVDCSVVVGFLLIKVLSMPARVDVLGLDVVGEGGRNGRRGLPPRFC